MEIKSTYFDPELRELMRENYGLIESSISGMVARNYLKWLPPSKGVGQIGINRFPG